GSFKDQQKWKLEIWSQTICGRATSLRSSLIQAKTIGNCSMCHKPEHPSGDLGLREDESSELSSGIKRDEPYMRRSRGPEPQRHRLSYGTYGSVIMQTVACSTRDRLFRW